MNKLFIFFILSLLSTNVLFSIQIEVSSFMNDNNKTHLIDGKYQTRWESKHEDNQLIDISFFKPKIIDTIIIHWENAYAKKYKIHYYSDSQKKWILVKEINKKNNRPDYIKIGNIKTRKLRISLIKRATEWGFSIYEIEFAEKKSNILSLNEFKKLIKDFRKVYYYI